jgi:hypothetical protein
MAPGKLLLDLAELPEDEHCKYGADCDCGERGIAKEVHLELGLLQSLLLRIEYLL